MSLAVNDWIVDKSRYITCKENMDGTFSAEIPEIFTMEDRSVRRGWICINRLHSADLNITAAVYEKDGTYLFEPDKFFTQSITVLPPARGSGKSEIYSVIIEDDDK